MVGIQWRIAIGRGCGKLRSGITSKQADHDDLSPFVDVCKRSAERAEMLVEQVETVGAGLFERVNCAAENQSPLIA